MSLKLDSHLIPSMLNLMLTIGIACIAVSIIILSVGTALDHSFLLTGVSYCFPLIITGIIIIWIASKLSEILE